MGSAPKVGVLGLGGVGAFALRALARRGIRPQGLEQFQPGHDRGSSHGGTRVFRHAYFEHPGYVPLLLDSTEEFGRLERDLGQQLLERCGTLVVEREGGRILDLCAEAGRTHGLALEALGPRDLQHRFPALHPAPDHRGLFEPAAGFVRPEAATLAALLDASQHGAEAQVGTRVVSVRDMGETVLVQTEDDHLTFDRLIVCAGPWTAKLLPKLNDQLRVTRQVQAWVDGGPQCQPSSLPAWFLVREEGPSLYGIPGDPLAAQPTWTKIALHGSHRTTDPDEPQSPPTPEELQALLSAAQDWLPASRSGIVAAKTCFYTSTPDEQFLLGPLPGSRAILIAAGLSGHGFKLTPALGEALAALALGEEPRHAIEFLDPSRPLDP